MDLTRNLLRTQLFDEDDDTSSYEDVSYIFTPVVALNNL